MKSSSRTLRRAPRTILGTALLAAVGLLLPATSVPAAVNTDWSGYEHGPAHSSASFGDTAITPANVAGLHVL